MERLRYNILVFIGFLSFVAQGQKSVLHHKLVGDTLLLRFEPKTVEDWLPSVTEGLRFVVRDQENERIEMDTTLYPVTNIYVDIHQAETESDYLMVAGLIHINEVPSELLEETFPAEEYTTQERDEARLELMNYFLHSDFELTKFAGLGMEFSKINIEKKYLIEVYLGNDSRPIETLLFNPKEYKVPDIPEMVVNWQNMMVDLEWNSKLSKPDFYGYRIFYKMEHGDYALVEEEPYINVMDTSSLEIFHTIKAFKELENNDSLYTLRLYGTDYFGGISENFNEVEGTGRIGIGLSPLLTKFDVLKTNEVDLEWTILPEFEENVGSWSIYYSQEYGGPYTLDTSDLSSESRSAVRPIPESWNFFRVEVIDDLGKGVSSFPQLVIAFDTIPPEAPTGLKSDFISENELVISWNENKEEDLYGYKVFYVFDTTQTMGLLNEFYLTETQINDTLFLASGHEHVYYMVIAADNRNNISEFSNFLEVDVPDILPPIPPIFYDQQPGPGKTTLFWTNSPSEDIVRVDLLRQSGLAPGSWELVTSFDGADLPEQYIDSTLTLDVSYQYTMVAVDEVNLRSEPSPPIVSFILPPDKGLDINDFSVVEEGRKVIIKPNFTHPDIFQIWVFRKKGDDPPRLHRIIEPGRNDMFAEDWVGQNEEKVLYFLQAYFEDGEETPFSIRKSVGL